MTYVNVYKDRQTGNYLYGQLHLSRRSADEGAAPVAWQRPEPFMDRVYVLHITKQWGPVSFQTYCRRPNR